MAESLDADLAIRTAASTPHQLVVMLFTGLLDELSRAKGYIQARRHERQAGSINKCIDILNALIGALDFDNGGELALRLAELYDGCVYRLYDASHHLAIEQIEEVEEILRAIQHGWEGTGADGLDDGATACNRRR
ncbi:flagellar export chaperone FliS [Erwinia amylovora]